MTVTLDGMSESQSHSFGFAVSFSDANNSQQKSLTSAINIFQHKFDGPNIVFPSEVSFSSLLSEAQNPKLFWKQIFRPLKDF